MPFTLPASELSFYPIKAGKTSLVTGKDRPNHVKAKIVPGAQGRARARMDDATLTRTPFLVYNGIFMDGAFWRSRIQGGERNSMKLRIALVVLAVCAGWAVSACFG